MNKSNTAIDTVDHFARRLRNAEAVVKEIHPHWNNRTEKSLQLVAAVLQDMATADLVRARAGENNG